MYISTTLRNEEKVESKAFRYTVKCYQDLTIFNCNISQ